MSARKRAAAIKVRVLRRTRGKDSMPFDEWCRRFLQPAA